MLADSRWRRREWLALAALAVLYYAVPWPAFGRAAGLVGAPVLFILLVMVPGEALVRRFDPPPRDVFEHTALAAMLGLCVALAACFLWALWRAPMDLFRLGYPVVAIAMGLAAPPPHRDAHMPVDRVRITPGERRAMWIFGAVVVVVATILWVSGPTTYYTTDTIDHAAYVNEIAKTGDPFPHTAFYKDPGSDGADLRKSLLHAFFGVAKKHLGLGALSLFAFFGAWQFVILCFAVYTFLQILDSHWFVGSCLRLLRLPV